jgi:hypothetical protein
MRIILSPSHTVGLELEIENQEEAQMLMSSSHTVGLERKRMGRLDISIRFNRHPTRWA